jgi:hypothetical protein
MRAISPVNLFFYGLFEGADEGVGGVKASGTPNGRDSTYRDVEGNAKAVP